MSYASVSYASVSSACPLMYFMNEFVFIFFESGEVVFAEFPFDCDSMGTVIDHFVRVTSVCVVRVFE